MAVTIQDIADKVGVTNATVSLALNKNPRISQSTAQRVLNTAKALGYKPSAAARSLVNKRTENLGLLYHTTFESMSTNPFYSGILNGIQRETEKNDYNLLFASLEYDAEDKLVVPKILRERVIDGLIVLGGCDPELINGLSNGEIPILVTGNYFVSRNIDFIVVNNKEAAYNAVRYLYESGHRLIGYVDSNFEAGSFLERFNGYKELLREFSLPEVIVAKGCPCNKGGYDAMMATEASSLPSAIFCANDGLAIGAMKAIKEKGLRIPEDISIIGFDDQEMASYSDPPLTTVRFPREEMGKLAVKRLLERINGVRKEPVRDILKTELVIRGSCRKIEPINEPRKFPE